MDLIFKKTNELSANEKKQICTLFKTVFEIDRSMEFFDKEFQKNFKGYSYHSLMIDNENIVGVYSAIPVKYNYFGKEIIFAVSVDTMIHEDYRGNPFNLKKLANLIYKEIKKDNIPFVFGAPNKNVYLIRKKILKWKDIGILDFYLMPTDLNKLKPKIKFLNPFLKLMVNLLNLFVPEFNEVKNKENIVKNIKKIADEEFLNWRFFDNDFNIVKDEDKFFVYKNRLVDGLKTAYIMDFYPSNKNVFESAVKYVTKKEKNNVDMVLYTGKLNFTPVNLFKLPHRFNYRPYHVAGIILDEEQVDKKIFDIKNWSLNISNFDIY